LGSQSEHWRNVLWYPRRALGKGLRFVGLSRLALIAARCGTPAPLLNRDLLWRRFIDSKTYWTWDDDVSGWIPNRHYLRFDPDLSAFWNWHLAIHGMGPESVLSGDPRYSVVGQLSIGDLRERFDLNVRGLQLSALAFVVRHSPNELSEIGCAHCSVDYPTTAFQEEGIVSRKDVQKALQTDIARRFSWIIEGPPIGKPDGS
jgi:hypothetical protein